MIIVVVVVESSYDNNVTIYLTLYIYCLYFSIQNFMEALKYRIETREIYITLLSIFKDKLPIDIAIVIMKNLERSVMPLNSILSNKPCKAKSSSRGNATHRDDFNKGIKNIEELTGYFVISGGIKLLNSLIHALISKKCLNQSYLLNIVDAQQLRQEKYKVH